MAISLWRVAGAASRTGDCTGEKYDDRAVLFSAASKRAAILRSPLAILAPIFTDCAPRPIYAIAYQAKWDLLTGKALNENTDEFFYKDITSVSMKAESVQLSKADIEKIKGDDEIIMKIHDELMKRAKKLPNEYEKLVVSGQQMMRMSTSGGNNVEVFLKNSEIDEIAGFKTRDTAEMKKGIQNLRKLIREKKSE